MEELQLNSKTLKDDILSSIVVFLVAVPLCLGIALASNAPMFSGIIAGIVGGLICGSASKSQLGVSGPAAGLAVIVAEGISGIGFEAFLMAVFVSGILQIAAGYFKAGGISHFFPNNVIKGMLSGIGILIALKQVPHFFGYDPDPTLDYVFQHGDTTTFTKITDSISYITPGAFIISLACLFTMIAWDSKYLKSFSLVRQVPSSLVVVLLGVLINEVYGLYSPSMKLFNDMTKEDPNLLLVTLPVAENFLDFFAFFSVPDFSQILNPKIYPVALTLALVASIETLLNLEATDKLDPYKRVTPTNRELKAQGLGNMASGLIGGLPVTQVIVRSAANIQAGGKTKRSAVFHGFFLLCSAMFFPTIMNHIPLAALSVILILVGYKLAKPQIFRDMYKQGYEQFLPFLVTVGFIVFTDLLTGIALGMACAVFFILKSNYTNPYAFEKSESDSGRMITITFPENVSFLNKAPLKILLEKIEPNTMVYIDATRSKRIDMDVIDVLKEFRSHIDINNITLSVRGIKDFAEEQASSFDKDDDDLDSNDIAA